MPSLHYHTLFSGKFIMMKHEIILIVEIHLESSDVINYIYCLFWVADCPACI